MAVDLELTPKPKHAAGAPCCEPVVYPHSERGALSTAAPKHIDIHVAHRVHRLASAAISRARKPA